MIHDLVVSALLVACYSHTQKNMSMYHIWLRPMVVSNPLDNISQNGGGCESSQGKRAENYFKKSIEKDHVARFLSNGCSKC